MAGARPRPSPSYVVPSTVLAAVQRHGRCSRQLAEDRSRRRKPRERVPRPAWPAARKFGQRWTTRRPEPQGSAITRPFSAREPGHLLGRVDRLQPRGVKGRRRFEGAKITLVALAADADAAAAQRRLRSTLRPPRERSSPRGDTPYLGEGWKCAASLGRGAARVGAGDCGGGRREDSCPYLRSTIFFVSALWSASSRYMYTPLPSTRPWSSTQCIPGDSRS